MKKTYRARAYILVLVFVVLTMLVALATADTLMIVESIGGFIVFGSRGVVELYAPVVIISDNEINIRTSFRNKYSSYNYKEITSFKKLYLMPLFPYLEITCSNSTAMSIPLWAMSRSQQKDIIELVGLIINKEEPSPEIT